MISSAAIVAQTALEDSADVQLDYETLCAVSNARVARWLAAQENAKQSLEFEQVSELLKDAEEFIKNNDFETALLLLDSAQSLIENAATPSAQNTQTPFSDNARSKSSVEFIPQIITGVDFWQQRFEFAFTDEATVSSEESANPFVGIRVRGNVDAGDFGQFSSYLQGKTSRDYRSGELELRHMQGTYFGSHWVLENRTEGMKYVREFDLAYVENSTSFNAAIALADRFLFSFGDAFRVRDYGSSSTLYSDFNQNVAFAGMQYTSGLSTRLYGKYYFTNRRHNENIYYDYDEHRVDLSVYQITAINSSIYFENIWSKRNYLNVTSTESFLNSYQDEYVLGDIRFGLSEKLSFALRGDFTLRQYEEAEYVENDRVQSQNIITPDYIHVDANPRFIYNLFGEWQVGLGYLYSLRVYSKDIIDTNVSSSDAVVETAAIEYEDYFSHGISMSLELFSFQGFMFSLTNEYKERRFPNAPATAGNIFNSDRRVNSILLFTSWALTSKWELSGIVNFDDDRALENIHSDAMNTLLSFDLSYTF